MAIRHRIIGREVTKIGRFRTFNGLTYERIAVEHGKGAKRALQERGRNLRPRSGESRRSFRVVPRENGYALYAEK